MRYAWIIGICVVAACSLKSKNPPYTFPETPAGQVPQPERNPATRKGVELGRKLFFDAKLSVDSSVSCMTCHKPPMAFTDGRSLTTLGVTGNRLLRHSPALFNLAWYEGLFWDGGSKNLESQVFGPLTHPDEMGIDLFDLVERLRADKTYRRMFREAFGEDTITTQGISRAISQYQRTLLSFGSHYDKVKAGKEEFTPLEAEGEKVYLSFCASCHPAPLFTDVGYHANGIDTLITDRSHELMYWGRYRITNDSADIGRYKTPSLRNLGFTAPYMHDGRFGNIDDVFAHYFQNHEGNPLADELLKDKDYKAVDAQQKKALKAFLYTLNDSAFVGF